MTKRQRPSKTHRKRNVDALLFIDANQYLNFYEVSKGKKLLNALKEQKGYIFVTKQIRDEVQRRKLGIAARFFSRQFEQLKVRGFEVPDHLLGLSGRAASDLRSELTKLDGPLKRANAALDRAANQSLEKISRSEDDVSKSLSILFRRAVEHSPEEIARAKQRKELGNPPGKRADPLGDQLSWEQLLTRCKDLSKIWIVTRDSDYCSDCFGEILLNPLLYEDLLRECANKTLAVFCFDNIDDALRHFVAETGVQAARLPTSEESKELKEQIQSLPPIDFLPTTMNDAASVVIQAAYNQRNEAARRVASWASLQDNIHCLRDAIDVKLK